MTAMYRKRKSANYSEMEKDVFLTTIECFKNIIETKRTDALSAKTKKETWNKITATYNSNVTKPRTADQLQQLWRNLKKKAKEQNAIRRKELFKTGGGHSRLLRK